MELHVVSLMNMPISNTLAPETAVIMAAQQALELAGRLLEVRFAGVTQLTELHLDFIDRDAPVLIPSYQFTLACDSPQGGTYRVKVESSDAESGIPLATVLSPEYVKESMANSIMETIHARVLSELRLMLSYVSDVQRGLMSSIHILEPVTTSD